MTRRTIQGMTITMWPRDQARRRCRARRQLESDLDLDLEDVDRGAEHDARHDQRQQQQVVRAARGRGSRRRTRQSAGRHAEREPDRPSRATPTWRLRRKPSTNLRWSRMAREPVQASSPRGGKDGISWRKKASQITKISGSRMIGQRDRRGAAQRDAADQPAIGDGPRPAASAAGGMGRAQRPSGSARFLWKRPPFMMADRCAPWSWNRPRFFSGSPSTTIRSAKAPGCDVAELAFLAHDLGADQRRRADDLDRRQHLAADRELAALLDLQRAEQVGAVGRPARRRACRSRATAGRRRAPGRSSPACPAVMPNSAARSFMAS